MHPNDDMAATPPRIVAAGEGRATGEQFGPSRRDGAAGSREAEKKELQRGSVVGPMETEVCLDVWRGLTG